MPQRIVLDTSIIIGLIDEKDVWHVQAVQIQATLEQAQFQPIIFDCVISEVISTLARRTHEKRRAIRLRELIANIRQQFPTKSIIWAFPDLPQQYEEVVLRVEQSQGELNFNDALIAVACESRGIRYVASFDADFDQVSKPNRISNPANVEATQDKS